MYGVVYEYRLRGHAGYMVVPFQIYFGSDKAVVDALVRPENITYLKKFRPTLLKIVVYLDNEPMTAFLVQQ